MRHRLLQLLLQEEAEDRDAVLAVAALDRLHFYRDGHVRRLSVTYFTSTVVVLTTHFGSR